MAELNTLGFNLWRSDDGAFELLNATLIPVASPGSVLGGAYAYVDSGVMFGDIPAYKLEEVEIGGTSYGYGPVTLAADVPTAVTAVITRRKR